MSNTIHGQLIHILICDQQILLFHFAETLNKVNDIFDVLNGGMNINTHYLFLDICFMERIKVF